MSFAEELAREAVLVKEGLVNPSVPGAVFPGVGVSANPALQASNQAKRRTENFRAAADRAKDSHSGRERTLPVSSTPTVPTLAAPRIKAAAEPPSREKLEALRREFEDAAEKEIMARRHAKWWEDAARSRTEEEDLSPGGYVGSAASRLLPVPHTALEAGVRFPAVGLGGYVGRRLGSRIEPISSSDIQRVIRPVMEDEHKISPLLRNLREALGRDMGGAGKGSLTFDYLQTAKPEALSEALRHTDVALPRVLGGKSLSIWPKSSNPEVAAIRSRLGPDLDVVRKEIKNILNQTVDKGLTSRFRPYRWGGALAGMGAASALTGIPLAIRALLQKSKGGESAVRARAEAERLIDEAKGMRGLRAKLLASLPQEAPTP